MFVSESFGFAESDSINDRGVIESVADDCVFGTKDGLEETRIGIESAGEKDGVL